MMKADNDNSGDDDADNDTVKSKKKSDVLTLKSTS